MCRNADPSSRQYSPSTATLIGTSSSSSNSFEPVLPVSPPGAVATVTTNATTLSRPRISETTPGRATIRPPYGALARRTVALPCFTQSGHWKPTAAGRRHSGQIGRSQRVQDTHVSRSGCR